MDSPSIHDKQACLEIMPIAHPLAASVCLPGSKSLTNRALLIAALANGKTTLTNALFSDDSEYFSQSLQRLGFEVRADKLSLSHTVHGLGGRIPVRQAELYIGNAGTAARFLTAMLCLAHGRFGMDGDPRMHERPIGDLIRALNQLGAQVFSPTGCLPLTVDAAGLAGGKASIFGDVSSQFLSGLLMVAPYAESPVEVVVLGGLNSKPYIDMTLGVMADFGVEADRDGYERFQLRPSCYLARESYAIETDASAASYFFAAPAVLGGTVRVGNISKNSKQGDIAFLDVLQQMGCKVQTGPGYIEVTGPDELRGVDVDMRDISDTAQTLAAIAPFASSPTRIRGIGFIRAKETDRIAAVCAELSRLGVKVCEDTDGMTIFPARSIRHACVYTYNDHRMAMAFSLIGLRAAGISIENPACVSKTFPNYFDVLETLR